MRTQKAIEVIQNQVMPMVRQDSLEQYEALVMAVSALQTLPQLAAKLRTLAEGIDPKPRPYRFIQKSAASKTNRAGEEKPALGKEEK